MEKWQPRRQLRKACEVFKILAGEEEEHRVLLENYLEKGEFPQISPELGKVILNQL